MQYRHKHPLARQTKATTPTSSTNKTTQMKMKMFLNEKLFSKQNFNQLHAYLYRIETDTDRVGKSAI